LRKVGHVLAFRELSGRRDPQTSKVDFSFSGTDKVDVVPNLIDVCVRLASWSALYRPVLVGAERFGIGTSGNLTDRVEASEPQSSDGTQLPCRRPDLSADC
jgi:hypothetical protein